MFVLDACVREKYVPLPFQPSLCCNSKQSSEALQRHYHTPWASSFSPPLHPTAHLQANYYRIITAEHSKVNRYDSVTMTWFFFFSQRISPEIIISKLTTYHNANAISLLCYKALTWRWVTVVSLTQIEQILVSLTQKTQACDKCVNLIADNVTVVSASKGKKKNYRASTAHCDSDRGFILK